MENGNNLHLVKSEAVVLNTFEEYQEGHFIDLCCCQLTSEQDQDKELHRFESKKEVISGI